MQKKIPNDPKKFDKLMSSIDRRLGGEGVSIFRRPIHASSIISKEFGIPLLMAPPRPGVPRELAKYWPIAQRIRQWYEHQYGDRLKVHPGPGRMAFLINNDIWVFRFPRLFGSAHLVASHTIKSNRIGIKGKPLIHNILDSIDRLPEGLRLSLTDTQLNRILRYFVLGFNALCGLEVFHEDKLISSALADIDVSIDHMVTRNPEYGLSKWSSLQATEKMLKATMERARVKYPKTHDLTRLMKEAQRSGITLNIGKLIGGIQCNPGIRYGQKSCTLLDAVNAHHAVFKVSTQVVKELQRFKT